MKKDKIIIVIAIITVLLAIVSVCYGIFGGEKDSPETVTAVTVSATQTTEKETIKKKKTYRKDETKIITVPDILEYTIVDNNIIATVVGDEDIVEESPERYTNGNLPTGGSFEVE